MRSLELLQSIFQTGATMEQVLQELIWLQVTDVDILSIKGTADYIALSREGRDFPMTRKGRLALCEYAQRVANVTVSNCEFFRDQRDISMLQSIQSESIL